MRYSLNECDWILRGWNKNQWTYLRIMETGTQMIPPIPAIKATVPGSIHEDLLRAGLIEDYNYGLKTLNMEWIENREWSYETKFTIGSDNFDKYILCFDGIDYSGCVLLNNNRILDFEGTHLSWEVDVTRYLNGTAENVLKVIIFCPPEVDGQTGYTKNVQKLKPRFNYVWDWCPRMINVGIWKDVYLKAYSNARITDFYPKTISDESGNIIDIRIEVETTRKGEYLTEAKVSYNGIIVAENSIKQNLLCSSNQEINLMVLVDQPHLWYPNNFGDQPLYQVSVEIKYEEYICDSSIKTVGFRQIEYAKNEDSSDDSLPYTVVVNGTPIFLRGINWVPIKPFYGAVTRKDYIKYLNCFKTMNVNIIRVWGGAILEKTDFYELCDQMGLMVWQEFPQSSSGIDNSTCEQSEYIKELSKVAVQFVKCRRHHACHIIWCGGNELMWHDYVPIDLRSDNLNSLDKIVNAHDNGKLFLPASPSGHTFNFNEKLVGLGKNHDVHGPWEYLGPLEHYRMCNIDDSLIHTEAGCPAPPRMETLYKYADRDLWPPDTTNAYWTHRGAWWVKIDQMTNWFGDFNKDIDKYVKAFRYIQYESLGYSSESVRRKSPHKSGFIVWMGNEPFPNACNTSVIEYDSAAKPSYYKLKDAFSSFHLSLEYSKIMYVNGEEFKAGVYFSSDTNTNNSNVYAEIFDICGHEILKKKMCASLIGEIGNLSFRVSDYVDNVFFVRLSSDNLGITPSEYIFTINSEFPLKPIIEMTNAAVSISRNDEVFILKNISNVVAAGVFVIGKDKDNNPVNPKTNYFIIKPDHEIFVEFADESTNISMLDIEGLNLSSFSYQP